MSGRAFLRLPRPLDGVKGVRILRTSWGAKPQPNCLAFFFFRSLLMKTPEFLKAGRDLCLPFLCNRLPRGLCFSSKGAPPVDFRKLLVIVKGKGRVIVFSVRCAAES